MNRSLRPARMPLSAIAKLGGIAAAIALVFGVAACGNLGNSAKPNSNSIEIKDDKLNCIKTLDKQLDGWVNQGTGIDQSITCLQKALDEFTTKTHGDAPGTWSRQALAIFLGANFAKNNQLNGTDVNTWVLELIRLKVLLLGGSQDVVTADEIKRVRDLLERAKPLLVNLSPYLPIITLREKPENRVDAKAAGDALIKVAELLANELNVTQNSASLDERPILQISSLVETARNLGLKVDNLDSWLPLAESLKSVIAGGEKSVVLQREWPTLIRGTGQVWSIAMRIKYDLNDTPHFFGSPLLNADLPKLERLVNDSLSLVEQSIRAQGVDALGIETPKIESLIDALSDKELMPLHMTPATAKKLINPILTKVLHGNSKGSSDEKSRALSLSHAAVAHEVVLDWLEGQKAIIRVLNGANEIDADLFVAALSRQIPEERSNGDERSRIARRAVLQLKSLYSEGRPLIYDRYHRLLVASRRSLPKLKRSDLDLVNFTRAGLAMALRGYSHDPLSAQTTAGLTANEAQEVYLDARDLGKEMGLFDTRNNTAGTRTYMEASIFQSSSHAGDRIDLHEVVDWFGTVLGGGSLADQIYAAMLSPAYGCADRERHIDVLGKQKLDPQCFRAHFKQDFDRNFSNMPNLINWVRQDSSGKRLDDLEVALENAGRNRGYTDALVDSSEMRALMPILHYAESIFARFDTHGNGILDKKELYAAFPILQPFIRQMGQGNAEETKMQMNIFSYLLQFGHPPTSLVDKGFLVGIWSWARTVPGAPQEWADRIKVLNLIGSFTGVAKQERADQIRAFYAQNGQNLRQIIAKQQDDQIGTITSLFQCLPESTPIIGELLRQHTDDLAPVKGKLKDKDFIERMKSLIAAEPKLEIYCLPF